jgi:hypothetical protein
MLASTDINAVLLALSDRRQLPISYFKLKVSKLVADGRLKLTAVNAGVNAAA